MPKYVVTLPVSGYCIVDVEAENEDAAIEVAMEVASQEHLESWQTHKRIVYGNVCSAEVNEASATLDE